MELLGFGVVAVAMVVAVFGTGVLIQVLFDRRFGVPASPRVDAKAEAHRHAVRSGLGGFGSGGGPQH